MRRDANHVRVETLCCLANRGGCFAALNHFGSDGYIARFRFLWNQGSKLCIRGMIWRRSQTAFGVAVRFSALDDVNEA